MNILKLSADLKLLFLSLVVSISAITSVGFFTEQVKQGFESQAADLLAADMRISSGLNFSDEVQKIITEQKLQQAQIAEMPTMLMTQAGDMKLVSFKAVSSNYPLRSQLKIETGTKQINNPPKIGQVYMLKTLAQQLNLKLNDSVSIGYKQFSIAGFILFEPDKVGNLFEFAPKVMINYDDLAATKLIQPGSRVKHRLLLAGNKTALKSAKSLIEPLCTKCKIETVKDANPQIKQTLDTAADFLQLAALVSIILAGAAMVMSVQQYAQNQVKKTVLKRTMGASLNSVIAQELVLLAKLTFIATLFGASIGYFGSQIIHNLMGNLISLENSAIVKPILSGALTALVMVIGFTLPSLLSLKKVSVAEVLRQENNKLTFSSWNVLLVSLTALFLILMWNSEDKSLASYLFIFIIIAMLVIYLMVGLFAFIIAKIPSLKNPNLVGWQMGVVLFLKRRQKNTLQITALAIGVLVVVLLGLLRGDMINIWQASLDDSKSNVFLINVQTDDLHNIKQALTAQKVEAKFSPMIRARLTHINKQKVSSGDYDNIQAQRLLNRAFNLSYSDTIPKANKVEQGDWWNKGSTPQLSFEIGIAKALNIKLFDELSFDIAGQSITAKVSNIRSLKWQSFDVNFFVLGNNGWLENYPKTWISSFYLADTKQQTLNKILTQYPHITALDIKSIMKRIKSIINKVSQALEFVFLFTLLSALLVLFAAANATKSQRKKEIALQKVFGASKIQIKQSLLAEYAIIAFLAVLPACVFALGISNYLAISIFELPGYINVEALLIYIPPALLLIILSGWLANKKGINTLPIESL